MTTKEKPKDKIKSQPVPKVVAPVPKKSTLKGVAPEKIESRLKLFLYGETNVGKTLAALQFCDAYIIDTERGTVHYGNTIKKARSVVLASTDFMEIKLELQKLLTEEHGYKTLIIDPITTIYNTIQEHYTRLFEKDARAKQGDKYNNLGDFGLRYWSKVKSAYKSLQRLILKLDMNVIITAHQKNVYGQGMQKLGVAPDSLRGDEYFFDLVFRLEKMGKERRAITVKERAEIGKAKFPEEFVWSYENFLKYYGASAIERQATPLRMATKNQVELLEKLLEVVKIDDETVNKWLAKANIEEFNEFTEKQILACISAMEKRLNGIKEGGVK